MQIARVKTVDAGEVVRNVKGDTEMNDVESKPLSQATSGQSDSSAEALLRGPSATPFSKLVYHLMRAEDEAAKAQLADDIDWILMPTGQSIKGEEQLFQFIRAAWTSVRERKPELLNNTAIKDWGVFEYWNIGVVDEEVIEFARATWGRLPSDISSIVGQTYRMPVCFVYHVNAEGKVDLVREYLDPATFIRELLPNKVDAEEVVRKYIYAKDNHHWDELVALLDPDFTSTDPSIPEPVKGIKAVSEYFPMLDQVGMKTRILTLTSEGENVAAELEVTCTINLAGEARSFPVKMAKFYRVNSRGLLADEREYSDTAAKFRALGDRAASEFQSLSESTPDVLAQLVGVEPASHTEREYSDTATKLGAAGRDSTGGSETSEEEAGDEKSGISTTDPSPKSIFETRIPENLKANLDKIAGVNAICQFNITGETGGSWYIDMTVTPPAVVAGRSDQARCTMTCSDKVLAGIVSGKNDATMAVITGKLKIAGDMGVAGALRMIIAGGDRQSAGRHD